MLRHYLEAFAVINLGSGRLKFAAPMLELLAHSSLALPKTQYHEEQQKKKLKKKFIPLLSLT